MSAFDLSRAVETAANSVLLPYLRGKAHKNQIVVFGAGRMAAELQKTADLVFQKDEKTFYCLEIKAEQSNKSGNLFLETWSNKSRLNPGWLVKSRADYLLYYFVDSDELYRVSLPALQRWAFACDENHRENISRYPEKKQSKYDQLNDTWGACVPLSEIGRHVGFRLSRPKLDDDYFGVDFDWPEPVESRSESEKIDDVLYRLSRIETKLDGMRPARKPAAIPEMGGGGKVLNLPLPFELGGAA